ncbi:MAG: LuxR C-terminal-related transcriptional regulator [Terrimicrobiaceae bacterium]|nr:LuxR C-terminal-related transcriptional regulator [Terrimicrobiaceae bacterium]
MIHSDRPIEILEKTICGLRALGVRQRALHSAMLREILAAHPALFAVWFAWEPDAFDGRDRDFRNAPEHDTTGRFVPYWHRANGQICCEPLTGYGPNAPGDWYSATRRYGQPCAIDQPFVYPVAGQLRWITAEISPILEFGRFVGVVGIDKAARPIRRADPSVPSLRALGRSAAAEKLRLLTSREREVHYWLCQGKTNEEIALILGISSHTVKNHLSPIFQKLGIESRYAAIAGQLT